MFEDYVRTRESELPPAVESFSAQLPDDDSKRSFLRLVDSYSWTQDRLPRNVLENVVLAGRFRLIDRLGAGGMGQVWRAEDQKIGREVAVKVLNLVGTASIDTEAAFERETQLLAQLKHPGIVTVLDSDRDAEHRFLVMDLVEGKSLEAVIDAMTATTDATKGSRGRTAADLVKALDAELPAGCTPLVQDEGWCDTVVKILVEALLTLEAAHARRVVHRDLKPGNLMIKPGGQPVLLDFGLGGMVDGAPGDLTSSLFGTFRFVAPEQFSRGRTGADVRTDIYQMGIVLYEFLTLTKCFDATHQAELVNAIMKGQFTMPRALDRNIPRELEDICLRAMDANPVHRYQTATEFREALQRFLRREPVHPDSHGPMQRVARQSRYAMRRHRPWILGAAAVTIAAIGSFWAASAFAETVRLEALAPTPAGDHRFKVELRKTRFLAGFFRVEDKGTTWYCPAEIEGADRDGTMLLRSGEHTLIAKAPPRIESSSADVQLTCSLAPTAELFDHLRDSIKQMRAEMSTTGNPGVDHAWMVRHWDAATRSGAPELPMRLFFGRARWEQDSVEGRQLTWSSGSNR